jgi:hypothetical protein
VSDLLAPPRGLKTCEIPGVIMPFVKRKLGLAGVQEYIKITGLAFTMPDVNLKDLV